MRILYKEYFSFFSHAAGALLGLAGAAALATLTVKSKALLATALIYGISVTLLFSFSALYHAKKRFDNENSIWRRLDHFAIFLMIAGTYTPLSYIYLDGAWRQGIIIAQWSLVFLGFFFKLIFFRAPRYVSTAIYLAMGWMTLLVIGKIISSMDAFAISALFAGGVFFTVGAVIYMIKKPDPFPERVGFHGVFHVFILLGGISHFCVVADALWKVSRA
ncbi:MAG: hemolysin III family protein [Leptospirales bacterium]|nr:hemolysin III family protein [Leptospirales bacterium]